MQDYSDRELDSALIATIHHECFLMKASHDEFIRLGEKQILSTLTPTEQVQLFSSYSSFLHHLYEFFVACFMREQGSDKGFSGRAGALKKDGLFQAEVSLVFRGIASRLNAGFGEGWENDVSYYDVEIPTDFGKVFREVRNSTAHAITERTSGEIDLSDFYANYHKYVYELYRAANRYWGRFDIGRLDMKAISRFSVVALRS
ncbi:hypothetical protein [Pseudomonas sp. DrBHI1]|uniref:hypothetical protein n=1 Tax=Pseudomonas sp. DrBHI1 TaxID=2006091 RepID=UPI000B58E222|nr:hypothetical protein [Pseudomonas sp. DrBHI1]OWQ33348.1 hypothetical protein CC207_25300 [Pseudomonas sp. DrBHI1]